MISFPLTELSEVIQEREGIPLISTVQAPQTPSPQPYLLPVNSSSSRKTVNRCVSGSTCTSCFTPFTINTMLNAFTSEFTAIRLDLELANPVVPPQNAGSG